MCGLTARTALPCWLFLYRPNLVSVHAHVDDEVLCALQLAQRKVVRLFQRCFCVSSMGWVGWLVNHLVEQTNEQTDCSWR